MSTEICYSSAVELAARIRAKELSPVEVVGSHLERIAAVNPEIQAVVTLADDALEGARRAEQSIMRGEATGPLHGVPFTAKDCFDTEGLRTTRGSRLFADHRPDADATAVRRLREAGGILIGKTNLPEFALRAETVNLVFGRTLNPWNRDRTPGGSSGGEAAAIAAGLSPLGIGTDMGGSNRLPSHYCGIVGFKPTHGRIPLTGSYPELMSRYMHVGPIARTVGDVSLALEVMCGPDGSDPHSLPAAPYRGDKMAGELPPLKVGYFDAAPFAPVDREVRAAVSRAAEVLEASGCYVDEVAFPWHDRLPIDVCMDIVVAEGKRYFAPVISGREEELTPSIQGLLGLPMPTLESYLEVADKVEQLAQDVTKFFARCDLLLCPTSPLTAHGHEAATLLIDGQEAGPGHAYDMNTTAIGRA